MPVDYPGNVAELTQRLRDGSYLADRGLATSLLVSLSLEKPKIAPYINSMKTTLAPLLGISTDDVSMKATTHERLGYIGREEGVACYAVALLLPR